MNHEPTTHQISPASTHSVTVPVWLIMLMMVLLFLGALYFDRHGGWFNSNVYAPYRSLAELEKYQLPNEADWWLSPGKRNFEANCALCHNPDGMGKPNQAPPFVKSQWVLGPPERLIHVPLVGLTGPIDVAGQTYTFPAPMAAMGISLSDEDLAAVLSYMRNSWGNKAPPVTPEQVKAVRAKIAGRTQPYTMQDLQQMQ